MKNSVLQILVTSSSSGTLKLTSVEHLTGSKEDFVISTSENFTKGASLLTKLLNDIRKEDLVPSLIIETTKAREDKNISLEKLILLPFYLYLSIKSIKIKEFFILYEGVKYPLNFEIPKHFIEIQPIDSFLCLSETFS